MMDERTRELVQRSIDEKWALILKGEANDEGHDDCPLCAEFLDPVSGTPEDDDCFGCPISNKTGLPYCNGSPYREWSCRHNELSVEPWTADTPARKKAAQAMITFLEGLLEDE